MNKGKWLMAVVVATGVLLTPYSEAAQAQSVSAQGIATTKSETKKLADLDAKVVETAKKIIRDLTGTDVALKDEVTIFNGTIIFSTKEERRGTVQINQKKGNVELAAIEQNSDKADPKLLELAKSSLKDIDANLTFEVKKVTKMAGSEYKPGGLVTTVVEGKHFAVTLRGDKLDRVSINYPKSMWNAEIKKQAEREFKAATGRTMVIEDLGRLKDQDTDIWTITGENSQSAVIIDVQTGKIRSISDAKAVGTTDKAVLTEKNAVSYASTFAKKAFNIDLTGYTAKKIPDFPNVYELTKKGAPTIDVHFNSKKGVASMSIKQPVKGAEN